MYYFCFCTGWDCYGITIVEDTGVGFASVEIAGVGVGFANIVVLVVEYYEVFFLLLVRIFYFEIFANQAEEAETPPHYLQNTLMILILMIFTLRFIISFLYQ